jgi:hypothetical protein
MYWFQFFLNYYFYVLMPYTFEICGISHISFTLAVSPFIVSNLKKVQNPRAKGTLCTLESSL